MITRKKYEEPLAHQLIQITKKYLGVLADHSKDIPLERYHYTLLLIDENNESLTQKEIANLLQVDKSFMVNMIDYLENNGFVIRKTNNNDRRQYLIKLTEKSKGILPQINQVFVAVNQKALKSLSQNTVNCFFEVLETLQNNLKGVNINDIKLDYKNLKSKG
ncbi:MarR family transcriptional regulator [Pedobacter sp. SD-b]|uniref:MarR family transcriptional regulator n=1 Tax=Pedobacter segetis TaxID=2793069 RepID=A0ABS1BKG0_9SPHI|nr:MarR family transcriptional regulator [Pedobacter segetis]MBK0383288.1 MarR family transcriptional regulator [Pedobacter segetis]